MAVSVDEVMAQASAAERGADDFGRDEFLPGLTTLLAAAATSPHAGPGLDARVRGSAANVLASRLASEAAWRERPECLDRALPPQVVVVGLPRSGTTALHQLLAVDPAFQWIPAWLAPRPKVRPGRKAWGDDVDHRARMASYRPNPLHDVEPDDPEECIQVMQQSFVNMTWVSSTAVPDYHEWFLQQDERPSYRRYVDNLRLIGADDPDRTWLLKNPSHTFGMAAMLDVMPDAVFVHIARDPAESIVSGCSLIAATGQGDGAFTPDELGAHRLRVWSMAAERMEAARANAPERTFVDVDYRNFFARPVAAVAAVYRALGRELSPAVETAMQEQAAARPKDRLGSHRYAAEDFGLTEPEIRDRMAAYVERYHLAP